MNKTIIFMEISKSISLLSPCLSRKVGCILLDENNHILSTGYNGPPKNIKHCTVCFRKKTGEDLYKCHAVHAEMNALLQCSNIQKIKTAFITINPCFICLNLLLNTSCELIVINNIYTEESYKKFINIWKKKMKRRVILLNGK